MDCSPPGSSVHGILQARILEWVAIPISRDGSISTGMEPVSLMSPALANGFFTPLPPGHKLKKGERLKYTGQDKHQRPAVTTFPGVLCWLLSHWPYQERSRFHSRQNFPLKGWMLLFVAQAVLGFFNVKCQLQASPRMQSDTAVSPFSLILKCPPRGHRARSGGAVSTRDAWSRSSLHLDGWGGSVAHRHWTQIYLITALISVTRGMCTLGTQSRLEEFKNVPP